MNLIGGKLTDDKQACAELEKLQATILKTLSGEPLTAEKVISACDMLSKKLQSGIYMPLLLKRGISPEKAEKELSEAAHLLSRESLEKRLELEFDGSFGKSVILENGKVRQEWKPLGTLFHIAAGNMDALPAFSVIEGLLTGNINILKLPGGDDGLSIEILRELIALEPLIADYVFVFDIASDDIEAMQKMAQVADAIVVWGGDAAITAVRKLAAPNTRIIEWGHKISFAYVSGNPSEADLEGIAENICASEQLLCSSCQGIFIDTNDFDEVKRFAERFFEILQRKSAESPRPDNPYLTAQKTLELYTEELESALIQKQVFRGDHCGVIACPNSVLMTSYQFRNCWVKPLPQNQILAALFPYKNHLQTVALICNTTDRERLESLFFKTGITRITDGKNMSQQYNGMPHDGEYSLRRYMKRTSVES